MNIAICDDDKNLLNDFFDKLKSIINQYNDNLFEFKYFCFSDPRVLLNYSKSIVFDIAFIDVEMPEIDGFSLGDELHRQNNDIFIFYVTSYSKFMATSIKHRVYRYIVKGDTEELRTGIKNMFNDIISFKSRYCFTFKNSVYSLPVSSIIYCESKRNKMIIHTDESVYEQTITLKQMLSKLPYIFCRCHSGYIVNVNRVKKTNPADIILDNDISIPLSKKYKTDFINKFINVTNM